MVFSSCWETAANLTNDSIMKRMQQRYLDSTGRNGYRRLPQGPGVGVELDSGILTRFGVGFDVTPKIESYKIES